MDLECLPSRGSQPFHIGILGDMMSSLSVQGVSTISQLISPTRISQNNSFLRRMRRRGRYEKDKKE